MSAKVEAGMNQKQHQTLRCYVCMHMCSKALSDMQLLMCVYHDQKSLDQLQYTQLAYLTSKGSHVISGLFLGLCF